MSESIASEVVSAMVGGIFSASALYPLEVLKTRMQAETKQENQKQQQQQQGGSGASAADSASPSPTNVAIHNGDDDDDDGNEAEGNEQQQQLQNYERQQQEEQQQLLKQRYIDAASSGMTTYAQLMYEKEGGMAPFYSGVLTSAIQSATEKALYFFAYTFYKNG